MMRILDVINVNVKLSLKININLAINYVIAIFGNVQIKKTECKENKDKTIFVAILQFAKTS